MSMKTCLFLIVIVKETLVLMLFLASHFDIIESWKLIVGHRDKDYAKKILNAFVCVEVRILVEKWNVYEGHIFPRPLLQTCRLETTSLCLNIRLIVIKYFQILITFIEPNVNFWLLCAHHVMTIIILHTRRHFPEVFTTNMQIGNDFLVFEYPDTCKKKFQIFKCFIEINVNVCLLCAPHVMRSIILHTRRPNCQKKVCCALGFCVSADFIFSQFEELKRTFFTSFHFAPRVLY